MKNKPYPALLRPSNLSNEVGKRVPKSRETIPLTCICLLDDPYRFSYVSATKSQIM
jgi:hypothetical protein